MLNRKKTSLKDRNPVTKRLDGVLSDGDQENNLQDQPDDEEDGKEDRSDNFVIDKIVSDRINRSHNHKYADQGKKLYHVRWYG